MLDTLGFASCALSQKETSYSKSPRRYVRKDFTERQNSQLSAFNESHAPKDFSYNKQENHNVITILFLIATPVFLVLESINVDQSLHVQHKYSRRRVPLLIWFIDPFFSNAPFLYPLKTSKNLKVFWCFQGVEKGCIGNEWVKDRDASLFRLSHLPKFPIYIRIMAEKTEENSNSLPEEMKRRF